MTARWPRDLTLCLCGGSFGMRFGALLRFDLALGDDSRSDLAVWSCRDAFGACFCVLFRFDRTPWGGYVAVLRRVAAALPRALRFRGSLARVASLPRWVPRGGAS